MIIFTVQIAALILAGESAIFLGKGNLGLSAEIISEIATTKYGYNPYVIKSLADQNADSWVGSILLFVSIVLQMTAIVFPSDVNAINLCYLLISFVICIIIFWVCWRLSKTRSSHINNRAVKIFEDNKI